MLRSDFWDTGVANFFAFLNNDFLVFFFKGTNPGLNLIWAHCNLLIKRNDVDMFIVVGKYL